MQLFWLQLRNSTYKCSPSAPEPARDLHASESEGVEANFCSLVPIRSTEGETLFLQRGTVVSGVSCTETGTGKRSFQGCLPTRALGCGIAGRMPACASRASLLWHACPRSRVNSHHHTAERAGGVCTSSSGIYLPVAVLCWGHLIPRATTKQLGRAASCCLSSIPGDRPSPFELFWGLCIDTLKANPTTSLITLHLYQD